MRVYIYGLRCPLVGVIRYIGKSVNPERRMSNGHLKDARLGNTDHHTARWLKKLLRLELLPELVIIEEVAEGERWQDAERRWIAHGREQGWPLTNTTAGGQGLDFIDPAADAAYRKNLSRAMKELWNRPERIEEATQRSLKAWADPEIRARHLASCIAAQNHPDIKAKLAIAKAEVQARPEVKAAKSAKMKAAWQKEEYRERKLAHLQSEEFSAEQSERLTGNWQDPEFRDKIAKARWSEEQRQDQAKRVLDPERQAKIQAAKTTPEARARKSAEVKAWWARRKAEAAAKAAADD